MSLQGGIVDHPTRRDEDPDFRVFVCDPSLPFQGPGSLLSWLLCHSQPYHLTANYTQWVRFVDTFLEA